MPFGKRVDPDCKRHRASPQHIHHAVVVEVHVEAELLQAPGEPPRGHLGLRLAGGPRARDLARGPDAGGGVGPAQLHRDHAVLAPVLHVYAVQSNVAQVQVAPHTKTAHHIVDHYVYFRFVVRRFCHGAFRNVAAVVGRTEWHLQMESLN